MLLSSFCVDVQPTGIKVEFSPRNWIQMSQVLSPFCCKSHDQKTCKLILGFMCLLPLLCFPDSEAVLFQEVSLPHVLPLGEPLRDLDLAEVLNALFQLLLHCQLFFRWPLLASAGVTGARCERAQQVTLPPLFRLLEHGDGAFFQWPVQSLDISVGV